MKLPFRSLLHAATLLALVLAALAMPLGAAADDDDDDDSRFGAWLYAGTEDDFGEDALIQFGSLEHEDDQDDIDDFDLSAVDASDFWEADGDVAQTIEQLVSAPHVIVIRSQNDIEAPAIAMGVVEGDVDERGALTIALQPVEDSGFAGMARFEPDDDDDNDTDIDIVMWEGALPASTPAA
jgi:hypothetical protein